MSPDLPADSIVGQLISSKYQVVREIGRGGMAAVYEARHTEIGKRVAIKILNPELASSASLVERFIREARAAAAIDSPYICAVHDVGRLHDGRPFLVLDLLQGESLYERLTAVHRLAMVDTVRVFAQICKGLAKAHEANIVHRDLKPENVFLSSNDEGEEIAKVVDFGLAKFYAPSGDGPEKRLTRDGALFGTPLYMSPEQVTQQGTVDHRVDLWALGCMVFECLVGRSVWDNERGIAMVLAQIAVEPLPVPSKLCPELPASFDAWFARALDRDPDKRFQTAREFAQHLAESLGFDPLRAPFASVPLTLESFRETARMALVVEGVASRETEPFAQSNDAQQRAGSVPGIAGVFTAPTITHVESSGRLAVKSAPEVATTTSIANAHPAASSSRRSWIVIGAAALVALTAAGVVVSKRWTSRGEPSAEAVSPAASAAPDSSGPAAPAAASVSASTKPATAPTLPGWAVVMRQGQQALADGDPEALKLFERAAETTDCGPTRMMLDHVRTAMAGQGTCRLTGLTRPRPAEAGSPARHGPLMAGANGLLSVWVDEHRATGQPGAFGAWLDESLRTGTSLELTKPGEVVNDVRLVTHDGTAALLWGQTTGSEPGIFLSALDSEGRLLDQRVRLSESRSSASQPSMVRTEAGESWVVWADDPDKVSFNIFARPVDRNLQASRVAVQLTRFAGVHGPVGPRATAPVTAVSGGQLLIAYRIERGQEHDILFHRVSLSDPQLVSGVGEWGRPPRDLVVGAVARISQSKLKMQPPDLACHATGCFITWKSEPKGVHLAAVDASTGEVKWRKVASASGVQPSIATNESGRGLLAWHEDGRLRVAPVDTSGMGAVSMVGRVYGDHPRPSLTSIGGAWLVSWTSFEAGHPEAYVARLVCE